MHPFPPSTSHQGQLSPGSWLDAESYLTWSFSYVAAFALPPLSRSMASESHTCKWSRPAG